MGQGFVIDTRHYVTRRVIYRYVDEANSFSEIRLSDETFLVSCICKSMVSSIQ